MSDDPFELWARENIEPTKDGPKVKPADQPEQALREKIAIAMAVGNNGGSWNSSYTEEHRKVWRRRADAVIDLVERERFVAEMIEALRLYDKTYASTQKNPTRAQEAACMSTVRAVLAKVDSQRT